MESGRSLVALFAAATILAACAGPRPLICEARGGPAWHQYRSQHFEILTDAGPAEVAATADRLELLQAQLLEGMVASAIELPGRLRVVALADDRVFRELAGPHVAGYFGEYLGEAVIVLPTGWTSRSPEIVAHELAHHLSQYLFPRQPRWFSEGLAGFVETVGSTEARARGRIGAVTVQRARALTQGPVPAGRELLRWSGRIDDAHPGAFHSGSWLLYGWLWNARSAQFTAYQRALAHLDAPATAWLAAFPEYDPADGAAMDRFDEALADYRRRGSFLSYPAKAAASARLTEVGRVPPADVHLLLLGVRRAQPQDREARAAAIRSEVEEALREDPLQPLALVQTTESQASLEAALRRATAARPGYALGWALLAEALRAPEQQAERERAYRQALALEPDSATLNAALAWHLVRTGRPGEALPLASYAVAVVPWRPRFLMTLALAESDLGRCESALESLRRALALLAPAEARRDPVQRGAAEVEGRCGRPATGAPAPDRSTRPTEGEPGARQPDPAKGGP